MELNLETLEEALGILGHLILDRGQHYEIVVIGGGGLVLSGEILRTTNDLVLIALIDEDELIPADPLPIPLSQDIHDVGLALNLGQHWINTGPYNLFKMGLPEGFTTRMQTSQYGGLTVHVAGRFDQICFKLYAAVEQGHKSKHFEDLKLLKPTNIELDDAKHWCVTHDVSEKFSENLSAMITALSENKPVAFYTTRGPKW